MKNNAYFSFQRPKDFITVFGQHVLEEFPHVLHKTSSLVNVKPKIEIRRVNQSSHVDSVTLKDIFYRGEGSSGAEDLLRLKTSNKLSGMSLSVPVSSTTNNNNPV